MIQPNARRIALAAILLGSAAPLRAQTSAPATQSAAATRRAPATQSAQPAGGLKIHVTAVQGGAQFRADAAAKWQALIAGVDLPEGVELRTGPKGVVQFTIGTDQVFRVDRLTVVKVLRASLSADGTIKTDVGMVYGRVSKDVDVPERPHDDTIVSPSSTLGVRGTRVSLYDQPPYAPEAVSLTGAAVYRNVKNQIVTLGAKGQKTKVVGEEPGAAQTALVATRIDPVSEFSGRTPAEEALLLSVQSIGGTSLQQLPGVLAGLFDSNVKGAVFGVPPIGAQLQFNLFWRGDPFSDVELTIIDPLGETLSETNPTTPSSGFHDPHQTADANGLGFSTAEFETSYPAGQYKIVANLVTGAMATAQVSVIVNPLTTGEQVAMFTDTLTPAQPAATHTLTPPAQPPPAMQRRHGALPATLRRRTP